jgi:hypothetical protein
LKKFFSKRIVVAGCLLLAALFVVRVPASRLRSRVVASISTALGRSVEVGSLHLRFLPRPGFEIENLAIHDDPAFGSEPLLRAPEVTASLQVGSLLRGRIQIASLSLSDASVNLARNSAGEWNFVDLLQRTSRSAVAPTASHRSSPQFPYIEGSGARINFKSGVEKTRFAFTDAKFALWQDSDNTWGARLRARPIRTDANLTDTGTVNVTGSWQRSAVLRETPVDVSFEWKQAQIGQVSSLVYGSDKGWRGSAALSGTVQGTPEHLQVMLDSSVEDFRRQDVMGGNKLRLVVHCATDFNIMAKALTHVDCVAPSGVGSLELTGNASVESSFAFALSNYDLHVVATNVPAQSVLAFVRHARPRFAGNLTADGSGTADITLSHGHAGKVHVEGGGRFEGVRLTSAITGGEVALGAVPFSVISEPPEADPLHGRRHGRNAKLAQKTLTTDSSQQPAIKVGPVNLATSKGSILQFEAQLSKAGYRASLQGAVGIRRLLQSAQVLGIPSPAVNADGGSTVDLNVAGPWSGERPEVLGSAHLRSVYAQVRGTNAPLQISRTDLVLGEDEVKIQNLTASIADATWRGSLRIPRPCVAPEDCEIQFNLHTAELHSASLNKFFNPAFRKQSWYRFLSLSNDKPPYVLQARARGKIAVDSLLLGTTTCSNFASDLHLHEGRLTLAGLHGQVLGGEISGDWDADFKAKPPIYKGAGKFDHFSLTDVSELMHNQWIDGTGSTSYEFTASGWKLGELLSSADLNADFSMSDGSFPRIVLTTKSGPLPVQEFSGNAQLHEGTLLLRDTKLDTGDAVYSVAGTASLAGALNFKISGIGSTGFTVFGDIEETRVSLNPTTAAALKP